MGWIDPDCGRSPGVKVLRVAVALALSVGGAALAQVPTSPGAGILRDLEQTLPSQRVTSPDGARIDVPDAPALGPKAQARITVRKYRITGNTAFDEAALVAIVASDTGEKSVSDLYVVAERLTSFYRARGYLLARAYLPQQEITDGIVTIAVLEGRYDQIRFDNTAHLSDNRVQRTMTNPLCAQDDCKGALIERAPLERGLLLLNDTPGARAAARLSPGDVTGTSTLDVSAVADRLVSGYVQLDNGGSYYSGVARGIGTLWINSPTGIGDQVTLQGVATDVHGNMYYGALGYGLPLGYSGARLGIKGSYLRYDLGDRYEPLDAHGTVKGGDAALFYPFIRSLSANLSGSVGYGERRFNDRADAVGVESERRITNRIEVGLNGDLRDELFGVPGRNTLSLTYTSGDLNLDDFLNFVDALTAHASGSYDKWTVGVSRLQPLFGDSSLYLRIAGQGTSDNLDSYEKFALGGPDAVRAYPASDTLVDEAVLYSIEWRQRFLVPSMNWLEGVLFFDHARGDLNSDPWSVGRNRVSLQGTGVGLNCALSDRMMLRSTLAWRGNRSMSAAPDSAYTYNLSLNMAF